MIYVTHNIADALSRAPIFPGTDELDIQVDTALAHLAATCDPALKIVHESIDSDYQQCMGRHHRRLSDINAIITAENVKGDTSIRDGLI